MIVENHLKKSKIHGFGVFASRKIKKGEEIWRFNSLIDNVITDADLLQFPEFIQKYIKHYSYVTDGKYVFCGDNGKYMNHSDSPNTIGIETEDGFGMTVAKRDILEDEEITTDYTDIDDTWSDKLGQ